MLADPPEGTRGQIVLVDLKKRERGRESKKGCARNFYYSTHNFTGMSRLLNTDNEMMSAEELRKCCTLPYTVCIRVGRQGYIPLDFVVPLSTTVWVIL
jgi:hypothetical protein